MYLSARFLSAFGITCSRLGVPPLESRIVDTCRRCFTGFLVVLGRANVVVVAGVDAVLSMRVALLSRQLH